MGSDRQQAKIDIKQGELVCEDELQAEHDDDENWHEFEENYQSTFDEY